MYTSPNMKLQVPVIGADNDPAWQSEIVYTFNKIDSHTHDGIGAGAKIPFNNINVATPGGSLPIPYMNNVPLGGLKYIELIGQNPLVPAVASTGYGIIEVKSNGDLFYISSVAQVKLSSNVAAALTGTAINGITGPIYQVSGGNLSYTGNANASTSFYQPGYHASVQYLANVFTFSSSTASTSTTSPVANIAAGIHYAIGNSSPSFYIYDLGAASPVSGSGLPPKAGYAAEFVSLGNVPGGSANSYQFGLRSQYASGTSNFAYPLHVFSVNSNFSGASLTSSGVVPHTHVFNAAFTDGRSPAGAAGDASAMHIVNYNSSGAANTPQNYMTYSQYAISGGNGNMIAATAPGEAGFGMQFRYFLQRGSAPVGTGPVSAQLVESARQEFFFVDTTNSNGAYRLQLSASATPTTAMVLSMAASTTGAAVQGVIGAGAARTTYFGGPLPLTAPGFVFNVPLYVTGAITPIGGAAPNLGNSSAPFGALYASNLIPAPGTTITVSGNLTVTGTITGNLASSSFVPSASYTTGSGSNYGLYLNNRVMCTGYLSCTGNAGTTAGFLSISASGGMNVASVVGANNVHNSKNGFFFTITTTNSMTTTNYAIITTVGSVIGPNDAWVVENTQQQGVSQFGFGLYNATGVNTAQNALIYFMVIAF
jgi:hypothetical protein